MNRIFLVTVIFSLILTSCDNGSDQLNSNPYESTYQPIPSSPTLLRGATVLTGNGERFENTDLILKNGKIDQEIQIPAFNVTSVTFVGKKLDHLFVTTASFELTKTQMKKFNHSGSSFIFKTNYQGIKIPYSNLKYNNDI